MWLQSVSAPYISFLWKLKNTKFHFSPNHSHIDICFNPHLYYFRILYYGALFWNPHFISPLFVSRARSLALLNEKYRSNSEDIRLVNVAYLFIALSSMYIKVLFIESQQTHSATDSYIIHRVMHWTKVCQLNFNRATHKLTNARNFLHQAPLL